MRSVKEEIKTSLFNNRIIYFTIIFLAFRFMVSFKDFSYMAGDFAWGTVLYLAEIFMTGPIIEGSIAFSIYPYASSFIDEYNTGFYLYKSQRSGLKGYIIGKIFSLIISSFLIAFLGHLFLALALNSFIPFYREGSGSFILDQGLNQMILASPWVFFLLKNFLVSLSFSVWGLIGLFFSSLYKSKYLSILLAIFSYNLVNYLMALFDSPYINDYLWGNLPLSPGKAFLTSLAIIIIFQLICSFLTFRAMEKAVVE